MDGDQSIPVGVPGCTWPGFSAYTCTTLFLSIARSAHLRGTALLELSSTLCPAPKWGRVALQACCQVA